MSTPSPAAAGAVPAPPPVRRARLVCLALLVALGLLCLSWELVLAPTGRGTLAIKAVPLALCLPGMLRHRLYTFRWLSLLVWLYVTEGLVRATSDPGWSRALAAAEVALAVLLFVACVHYIRLRVPGRRRAAPPAPATQGEP